MPNHIAERLISKHLEVDFDGEIVWTVPASIRVKIGQIAGNKIKQHYYVQLAGRRYPLSRCAWFLHYGVYPDFPVYLIRRDQKYHRQNLTRGVVRPEINIDQFIREGITITKDGWFYIWEGQQIGPFNSAGDCKNDRSYRLNN